MNVLVVAAHPDDEVLGCGGTIARHCRRGDRVECLILAEGATSRDVSRDALARKDELAGLREAAASAAAVLGSGAPRLAGLPDNRLDSVALLDVTKIVEAAIQELRPTVIYTHFPGDLNVDHRIAYEAVITACRPQPGAAASTILCFEVPSATEWRPPVAASGFTPNWFVDIGETLALKLRALRAYGAELRDWPHPRSPEAIEHLARWRGASLGVNAAEAFVLARTLELPGGSPR